MSELQSGINQRIDQLLDGSYYSPAGVTKTPLLHSAPLSALTGCNVYLKCEHLQTTGSFKIRGATSAILNLSDADREKGVITASSGNHGAATATAASALGIPVRIYVPSSINPLKEQKIRDCGATLIKIDGPGENAEREAARVAAAEGIRYVSPYNHSDIIAGQGTIAEEIISDLPDVDAVFTSVGGGGLISGIGSRLNHLKPGVHLVGCWPENATSMLECIKAGKILDVQESPTLSDGTAGGVEPEAVTLPLCTEVISETVTVSEREIAKAMQLIEEHHGVQIEGAAGVAVASLLANRDRFLNQNVVLIICGGNIAPETYQKAMGLLSDSSSPSP